MYLDSDTLVLSPSDLNGFVECRHLTALDRAVLRGELAKPDARDPVADLLSRKGDQHETAHLKRLRDEGKSIIEIADAGRSLAELEEAAAATKAALAGGPEVVYQATFLGAGPDGPDGPVRYRGHADFLVRRDDRPSELGDYSYEVADTKLATKSKPYFIMQLCFYSEMLAAAQGVEPERFDVILGTGATETFRLAEFTAYFRRVRTRFLESFAVETDTYPEPVSHCGVCRWADRCDERRRSDDHLSLVARLSSAQRTKLGVAGVTTLAELGRLDPKTEVDGIRSPQLNKVREQARLQLATRENQEPAFELLPAEPERGFARLPKQSEGDVFFDLEGDPFYEGGLEYLWGYVTDDAEGGRQRFHAHWGRTRAEERHAFEAFMDFVAERRESWPDLHVYHYANYEITVLKRLAGAFGTREVELDRMLRDGVFVDLYRVVAEGLRIGMETYGLKSVEHFYMGERSTEVTGGDESTVQFEAWLEQGGIDGGDFAILEQIRAYNEDDCVSTLLLRNWLLERREEAVAQHGEIEWYERPPTELSEEREEGGRRGRGALRGAARRCPRGGWRPRRAAARQGADGGTSLLPPT